MTRPDQEEEKEVEVTCPKCGETHNVTVRVAIRIPVMDSVEVELDAE